MADKMDLDENDDTESALRNVDEKEVVKSPDAAQELKEKTPEEIIHELRVHQIELEMQNEELKIALDVARDEYRDLYNFAPVGYLTMTHKEVIKEVNLSVATLLGMTRPNLIDRGFGHFVDPESLDQWGLHIVSVLGDKEKQSCDITLRNEDGSKLHAHLESIRTDASADQQAKNGGTHLIRMAISDITGRKRVDETSEETNAFLNTLLNAIPLPLFYKDTNGRFIGFNKSFEEFYGKTSEELVGKTVFDIHPIDLAEVYHAKDLELFHNPGVQVYDTQLKDAHGVVHDVVFHKSTFSDSQGHVLGLIGQILDITEHKRS